MGQQRGILSSRPARDNTRGSKLGCQRQRPADVVPADVPPSGRAESRGSVAETPRTVDHHITPHVRPQGGTVENASVGTPIGERTQIVALFVRWLDTRDRADWRTGIATNNELRRYGISVAPIARRAGGQY